MHFCVRIALHLTQTLRTMLNSFEFMQPFCLQWYLIRIAEHANKHSIALLA